MSDPTPDVEKGASDVASQSSENKETVYLHGVKLALVCLGLSLAFFIIILDQTILAPAMPVIASNFNAIDQIGWISSAYFITQCSSILLWGQILAYFNQKTPLILAIVLFEIGSLVAALSPNFVALIIGRAIAGIGGAAIVVAAISTIALVVEGKRRPMIFASFGLIFVLGSSLGPIIGGSFTSSVTWRWCFYINLPVGAVSIVTVALCIPSVKPKASEPRSDSLPIKSLRRAFGDVKALSDGGIIQRLCALDWIASALVLGSVTALTLALTDGGSEGWDNRTVIMSFVFSGFALILLILWEVLVMKDEGMIPLKVVRFRSVIGSAGLAFMRMTGSVIFITFLPTYFQATKHDTAIHSGIATLPYAIGMAVFAMIGGGVVQKSGRYKWALCLGSVISAVGGGLFYTLGPDATYARNAGFQVLTAAGAGLIQMNAVIAAQAEMDANGLEAMIPQASAFVSFVQLLGAMLGGSIGGSLLSNGIRQNLPSDFPAASASAVLQSVDAIWELSGSVQTTAIAAYAKALDDVFLAGSVASAVGLLFALLCRDINIKGKKFK